MDRAHIKSELDSIVDDARVKAASEGGSAHEIAKEFASHDIVFKHPRQVILEIPTEVAIGTVDAEAYRKDHLKREDVQNNGEAVLTAVARGCLEQYIKSQLQK